MQRLGAFWVVTELDIVAAAETVPPATEPTQTTPPSSPNTFLAGAVPERVTDEYDADENAGDEYDAVVYDLDGTLVDLDVDWNQVEREVSARLREVGVDPDDLETWELLDAAQDAGIGAQVNALISEHEIGGVPGSERLPTADELEELSIPVGVCSLNCELAVRAALEKHDLDGYVDAVVGRDSVPARKPDPSPLLATAEMLGVEPAGVLFVGDAQRDAETAERAGTEFRWV